MTGVRVVVVGGGLWGRALARAAARAGSDVVLASRRAEPPPEGARAGDLADAEGAGLVVLAVPTSVVETVADLLSPHLSGRQLLIHGVRGLVSSELSTISSVLHARTPARRLGALGGPALAGELSRGSPSVMVVASGFAEVIDVTREALGSPSLRLYGTRDLVGLEWASALTGCYAIGIGYAQGRSVPPGLVAAFVSRVVAEASRVAYAAGGDERTLLGLGGLGDLLAAAGQDDRPETSLGRALAAGVPIEEAKARAGQRIEALSLLPAVDAWAKAHGVRAPILHAIVNGLFAGRLHDDLVHSLMVAPFDER